MWDDSAIHDKSAGCHVFRQISNYRCSQTADKYTRIKGRLLYQVEIFYNNVPFQIETSI